MVIEKVNIPADLKSLSFVELETLAGEIRSLVIETAIKNGGHLAPSLGAVDLTVALHRVFDCPSDKIVWDVGHQAYAHKILTGRKFSFPTMRTAGGLSGFPNRKESEYDAFTVGHSSTSISSALGLAAARKLKNESHKVIAVIGDGSMTGGLAFEGLQNAGHLGLDLLVVLNDNEMFISHKVGAFASYLAKLLTAGSFKKFEDRVEKFFKRLHFWGAQILRVAKRFKVLLFPGMLFEELGFAYLGPVNGHDIKAMTEIFANVKNMKGPILVHLVTKKGKGYAPAEHDPTKYHGLSPSCSSSDNRELTYTQVFGEAMKTLAAEDRMLLAVTAAMSEGTGLADFAREYPERFFDVGIAEQHAVTFAAGLAAGGYRPVCAIYSTFLQRSLDQIIHDVALNELPVIFAIDRAGLVGEDGATHHGTFDLSFLRSAPGLTICAPRNGDELRDMLYSALKWGVPTAIRYPRGGCAQTLARRDFKFVERGKSEILRDGSDVLLAGAGNCARYAFEAADILAETGISAAVMDLKFVKPIDSAAISKFAAKRMPIFVVEENSILGGAGSAVEEELSISNIRAEVIRIAVKDDFITHGPQEFLRDMCGLTPEKIASRVAA
ncbi:MAG: 1-deoxy-D-xylulose-5-phosphate synthase, partial [Endomicrobiia bacterium]|nr:1-deoxy-D-xylulose-5-phosphate synthase [Endomicrobiia bacterium]